MCSIEWLCFRWPWVTPNPPKPPQFLHFSSPFISSKWVNIETSYLVYRLTVASPRWRTTNRPWKGRGYVTGHVLNFGCPIHISEMAEARALKLCTKEDYIKSGQRDDKSPLKGAWFCSRDPFFVCTAVHLKTYSPRHSASCNQHCRSRSTDCCISQYGALEAMHVAR